jgi:5-hydroxyisourate hydrolase
MAVQMKGITTHVLDIARGTPARDLPVRLERRENSGDWLPLGTARTDHGGRCGQLVPDDKVLSPGLYRLTFDTASYFAAENIDGLYPVVEVTFRVREGESHLHIPLLLSPNGYTTYRGS